MCEVLGDQQEDRKLDSQTIQPSSRSSGRANTGQQIKTDNVDVVDANSSIADYLRSSINRGAEERTSQVLTQKYTMNSAMYLFSEMGHFKGILSLQEKESSKPYQAPPRRVAL